MIQIYYWATNSAFPDYFALQGTRNERENSNLIRWFQYFFQERAAVANHIHAPFSTVTLALASSIKAVAPLHYRKALLLTTFASRSSRKSGVDDRLATSGTLAVIVIHCILYHRASKEWVRSVVAGNPLGVRFADHSRGSSKP